MQNEVFAYRRSLESAKRITSEGIEYWMAREIMPILAYASWDKFSGVIEKARTACAESGFSADHHFSQTGNLVNIGSGAQRERVDWFLSRYACYLIAMSSDSSKPEVAFALTYFAAQTRRQEISDDHQRLELRLRVIDNNKELSRAASALVWSAMVFFRMAAFAGCMQWASPI